MNNVPQVMVLHGLGATSEQFNGMFDAHLATPPLAINMPGHGDKPRENGRASFERFAALAIDALDQHGVAGITLAGISMGSGIAVEVARRRPERVKGLILLRPAWMNVARPANLKIISKIGDWLCRGTQVEAIDQLNKDPFYIELLRSNPAAASSILGAITRNNACDHAPVLAQMVDDAPFASLEDLHDITTQTLVVGTPEDPLHPIEIAQAWAHAIPHATYRELPSKYVEPTAFQTALDRALGEFFHAL